MFADKRLEMLTKISFFSTVMRQMLMQSLARKPIVTSGPVHIQYGATTVTSGYPMAPKRNRRGQLSGIQIMFAAIMAIGMILAINFSTRLADSRPLRDYYNSVETEIKELENVQATLIAERDYTRSDVYVEQWARRDGKMIRPGEVLVIPIPHSDNAAPTPTPPAFVAIDTSPPEPQNWTLWWRLFFDGDPPGQG
jgi:cell division protein FtsB